MGVRLSDEDWRDTYIKESHQVDVADGSSKKFTYHLHIFATPDIYEFVDSAFMANPSVEPDIQGTPENNNLQGNLDSNILFGLNGNDNLIGNGGDDLLYGGLGNDNLYGGQGADKFVLAVGEGADIIHDFNELEDSFKLWNSLSFEQLSFVTSDNNTIISGNNETLTTVLGVEAKSLSNSVLFSPI